MFVISVEDTAHSISTSILSDIDALESPEAAQSGGSIVVWLLKTTHEVVDLRGSLRFS